MVALNVSCCRDKIVVLAGSLFVLFSDPTATIRSSTPINVFITQEQNTNPLG